MHRKLATESQCTGNGAEGNNWKQDVGGQKVFHEFGKPIAKIKKNKEICTILSMGNRKTLLNGNLQLCLESVGSSEIQWSMTSSHDAKGKGSQIQAQVE